MKKVIAFVSAKIVKGFENLVGTRKDDGISSN